MSGTCLNAADVIFAVDNSATISRPKYAQLLNYITTVIGQLAMAIDSGKIRVGLLTFSQQSVTQFRLTTYSRSVDIIAAVSRLPYSGYDTNTAAALRTLKDLFRFQLSLLTEFHPASSAQLPISASSLQILRGAQLCLLDDI